MVFLHDQVHFHFDVVGEGAPIVFCHGLGGDSGQPRSVFDPIPGYQSIFWDCRGHGLTEPLGPDGGFNFDTFAGDLWELLRHINAERAIVGGISMGAATAVRFAVRWPDRVRALFLVRPAWLNEPNPPNLVLFQEVATLLTRAEPSQAIDQLERQPAFQKIEAVSRDVANSLRQQIRLPDAARRAVRLRLMPASAPVEDWEQLRDVRCPALVVGTARDPVHPLEYARIWSEKLREAKLTVITSKADSVERHRADLNVCLTQWLRDVEVNRAG